MKEKQMCDFNVNLFSFYYSDFEYFEWFRNRNQMNFNKIIVWKKLHRRNRPTYNYTWINSNFQPNYVNGFPSVTRAFLNHLNSPITFPIFDRNVWKAMIIITGNNQLPVSTGRWEHYEQVYMPFFNDLYNTHQNDTQVPNIDGVDIEIVQRRIIDRALFEFGRTHNFNRQENA